MHGAHWTNDVPGGDVLAGGTLTLPMTLAKGETLPTTSEAELPPENLSALAADDHPTNRKVVELMPHAGEMARLLDIDATQVGADPLAAARQAAERFSSVVVMKGASSHVVAPDGRAALYASGGAGLGTSGSGDVLAGLIAGLLARGAEAFQAASWGVWLHGEAGKHLAQRIGPLGFLAREIAAEVPALLV